MAWLFRNSIRALFLCSVTAAVTLSSNIQANPEKTDKKAEKSASDLGSTCGLYVKALSGSKEPLVGRSQELAEARNYLASGKNVLISGESRVGKTSFIQLLNHDASIQKFDWKLLADGASPGDSNKNHLFQTDRIGNFFADLKDRSVKVLYIEDIDLLYSDDLKEKSAMKAAIIAHLEKAITENGLQIVGELRPTAKPGKLALPLQRLFQTSTITLKPMPKEDIYVALIQYADKLNKDHGVQIDLSAIQASYDLALQQFPGTSSLESSKALLEYAVQMAVEKKKSNERTDVQMIKQQLEDLKSAQEYYDVQRDDSRVQAELTAYYERLAARLEKLHAEVDQNRPIFDRMEATTQALEQKEKELAAAKLKSPIDIAEVTRLEKVEIPALKQQIEQIRLELPSVTDQSSYFIGPAAVAAAASQRLGRKVEYSAKLEAERLSTLEERMNRIVVNQPHIVRAIAEAAYYLNSDLTLPSRPGGVFVVFGPSGVGKTLLFKAYMRENGMGALIPDATFDMTKYSDQHTSAGLVGAPPGYVGYDSQEGAGSEIVRVNKLPPRAMVLGDEIEKAHEQIFKVLYSATDEGILTTFDGTKVDFRDKILWFTSNAGDYLIAEALKTGEDIQSPAFKEKLKAALIEKYKMPRAFINRLTILVANPLKDEHFLKIVDAEIKSINSAWDKANSRWQMSADDLAMKFLAETDYDPEGQGRMVRRNVEMVVRQAAIVQTNLKAELGAKGIVNMVVHITVETDGDNKVLVGQVRYQGGAPINSPNAIFKIPFNDEGRKYFERKAEEERIGLEVRGQLEEAARAVQQQQQQAPAAVAEPQTQPQPEAAPAPQPDQPPQ